SHLPYALRPVIDRKHRSYDRQEDLRRADITRRLFAADVLLASLHCHAQGTIALRVDRNADDAARHGALIFVPRGKERGMRAAITHRNAEALCRTNGDVG